MIDVDETLPSGELRHGRAGATIHIPDGFNGGDAEVDSIDVLLAIEEVKRLRSVFCILQDSQDWDALRKTFAADAIVVSEKEGLAPGDPPQRTELTADDLIDRISARSSGRRRFHALHTPIIEITSETTARGVWPFTSGGERGYYDDRYVKQGDTWKFERVRIIGILAHDPSELTGPDPGLEGVRPLWDSLASWT